MKKQFLLIFIAVLLATLSSWSTTTRLVPSVFTTIQAAIDASDPGDIIQVEAGTLTLATQVNVNKANLTIQGVSNTLSKIQVSGIVTPLFLITADGVTMQDMEIEKTDKAGVQNIIGIQASNVTIKNNVIHGQFVVGDGEISRAIEVSSVTGLNIDGNKIYSLRQPAYINAATGTVLNNLVYLTKGWVIVSESNLTFADNTWGTGVQSNVYDIAIINNTPVGANNYTDIVGMSANNNDAIIENQHSSYPAPILSIVHIDKNTSSLGNNGSVLDPYKTITPAISRVASDGKILVAAGTYSEYITVNKSCRLYGSNAGRHPAVGTHPSEVVGPRLPETVLDNLTPAADNILVEGFKFLKAGTRIIDTYSNANGFTLKNCIVESTTFGATTGIIQFGGGSHTGCIFEFNLFKNKGDHTFYAGGGPYDNLKFQYNKFQSESEAIFWAASALTGGVIDGNEFDGESGSNCNTINIGQAGNLQLSNNWFHDNKYTAVQAGIIGGSVTGNKFERTYVYGSGYGSYAFQLWGGAWGTAISTNVTIENNEIHYNDVAGATEMSYGIGLNPPANVGDPNIDASTIHIHNNSFLDGAVQTGSYAIRHRGNAATIADATCNWWGTTNATSIAGMVFGNASVIPYSISNSGACTGGLPIITTIGTPTPTTCGTIDIPVTVQNFTDVGNISLKLNIGNPALSYIGITGAPAGVESGVSSGVFSLSYSSGTGITLSDNSVLFTLHFNLLPEASGAAANLTWDTSFARCEYSSPETDKYASTFNDLSWTIPVRPVKNTTTHLEYCTIQAAINDAATVATHTLEVNAALYTASEQVLVNKEVTIKGINGQPTVDFLGTVTGKPTLFDISANNVTIENIHFNVDLAKLRSSIIASAAGIDNITVKDNIIDCYGTPAGSYSDRNAVSINYGGNPANYRIATGGVDNIVFTNNTVNAGTYPTMFRAGIAVDEGEGTFSGNTLKTINQDIVVRFANNGSVTVSGNHANGGGMEFVEFNAGSGTLSITGNYFDGTFATTYSNALRLKNNYTARPTVVSGNTFTGFEGNVAGYGGTLSLENYQAVTLDANTFTPLAGSTTYRHITLNTKDFSSSSGFYAPVVDAIFTNNIFNGSGTLGGTAIAFYNWDNDSPVFNAITIGTAGNENTFNDGIGKFIVLDGSTGTVAPNVTAMVPWAIDLDAQNNKFAVSTPTLPSAMTLAQLFALEDKIDHKIDLATLGFVTVKANNDYVTVNSFVAPNTSALIQRGVDAASNGWTVNVNSGTYTESVNVNKSVILKGAQADNDARTRGVVSESVLNKSAGAFAIAADNVVINGFTIKDQTLSNSAPTWGYAIYMVPNHTGTQLLNNIIKNNIVGSSLANTGTSQVKIQYNWFDDNNQTGPSSGAGIYTDEYVSGGSISNVLIDNNKFTGNSDAGMDFSLTDPSKALTNATISNNLFDGNSRAAFYYNLVSSSFTGNTIKNSTGVGTGDVRIYGGVNDLDISNNFFIDGVPSGIRITNDGSLGNSNISVSNNSFTGYTKAIEVVSGYTGALSATCNWYETFDPIAIAVKISGSVNYTPWLVDGVDLEPLTPGFQPSGTCDETPPAITCPGTFTSGVNTDDTFVDDIGMATATDASEPITITKDYADGFAFPIGTTVVTWTARDLAGNTSTCNQNVIVTANTLSGTLMYNNVAKTGMDEVVLKLTDALGNTVTHPDGTPVDNVTTATVDFNKGKYSFSNLRAGTYAVSVFFNDNLVEYINSTDAGAVNLWSSLNTEIEYVRFLAGDVAGDVAGVPNLFINGTDALRIQQYFVYGTPFDRGVWSYWRKGVKIDDNTDTKPANFNVVVSGGNVSDFDIYAMVTGDFKGDYDGSYLKSANVPLALVSNNQMNVIADQEFELPLYAGSSMEVGAVSMILEIPSGLVEVQDIKVNGSEDPVSWAVKGNELRIGWYSLNPVSVAEKSSLLTLKLKASKSFNAGQSFDLTLINSPLNELADRNFDVVNGATILVAKVGNGLEVTGLNNNLDYQSLSLVNYPNPFNSWTTVAYTLPVDGKVSITLYNSIGQTVTSLVNGDQNAGQYSIRFDGSRLQPGMYVAKLRLINKNTEINGTIKLSIQK